jgi:hypothetical protein
MLRALTLVVLAAVSVGVGAAPASAHPVSLADAVAAAAADVKAAHAAVDQALKVRKQKLDAWQKAQKLKDQAAADVARKKKAGVTGSALESALQGALTLDEDAAQKRSALLAAESDVSSRGASLLKLYDGLLVERRRAVEALPAQSIARAQAVSAYRDLAAQRDAVRQALLPVLPQGGDAAAELPKGVDLEAKPDDDVDTLLEKADLARDLEERFLRQAAAVRQRIGELEEERAVQKGVSGMVGRSQLFDEEDRRLPVARTETAPAPSTALSRTSSPSPSSSSTGGTGAFLGGANDAPAAPPGGHTTQDASAPPPPTAPATTSESAFALSQAPTVVRGDQAATPSVGDLQGMLSSSNVSVESLTALEQKLKARAHELDDKQRKLKAQAQGH